MTDIIINNTYAINNKNKNILGNGSFGIVYTGYIIKNNKPVAIKMEQIEKHNLLEYEYYVYNELLHSDINIPRVYWYGIQEKFRILVLQRLGKSLDTLFNESNKKFSLKTTLMLGIQICILLEKLHKNGFVHRDLKPENFLIGLAENKSKIYIIDFGLSKRFKFNNMHNSYKVGKNFIGTTRYASVNGHKNIELSRRDDLESLLYILIYFYKGSLPWQKATTIKEKHKNIGILKNTITSEELCNNCPPAFLYFLNYVKNLEYKEKPNYKYLQSLLYDTLIENGYTNDLNYDWEN